MGGLTLAETNSEARPVSFAELALDLLRGDPSRALSLVSIALDGLRIGKDTLTPAEFDPEERAASFLEFAIDVWRGHPSRAPSLINFLVDLLTRFTAITFLINILRTIVSLPKVAIHRLTTVFWSDTHTPAFVDINPESRFISLLDLATECMGRLGQIEERNELGNAIRNIKHAMNLLHEGNPARARALFLMENGLLKRFQGNASGIDLDGADYEARNIQADGHLDLLGSPPELIATSIERSLTLLEAIVEESVAIQYVLALGLSGYVDGPSISKISTAGRYNRLQHHEKAWRTITWRQHNEYTIDRCSFTYELYGGVYAHGLKSQDSYVKTARPTTRGMKLIEFPSLLRNQFMGRTWTIPDLGVDTQDFGMDPNQNLLILMEHAPSRTRDNNNPTVSVHLLNLRDEYATPHSLARTPLLEFQPRVYSSTYRHGVQVVGDVLAVLFCPETFKRPANATGVVDELVIWNWKTGDCITSIKFEGTRAKSFSLLANDTILVPVSLGGRCPVLNVYRFEGIPGSTEARLMVQYSLPPMADSVDHCEVICRLDPSPWSSQSGDPLYKEGQTKDDSGKEEG
ncbi:hypothetical protein FRB94_008760 [Tulasnella sp. JGI-2019a]|nr:hypothetical protein FRB94_008760 [Tulasnella sp. JGI-2019a]